MPATSKAQFRFFQANRKELEGKGLDVDEWTKGVDYSKLPGKKVAAWSDYVLPVGGAALGGYLGKLWRDRQADKQGVEDDSWTTPLLGMGAGLGAGLLGQHLMTVSGREAAEGAAQSQEDIRQGLIEQGASAYGATPHRSGYGAMAHGRWLSGDDLVAGSRSLASPYKAPGKDGLYDIGPSTPTSHMRWRPSLPGDQSTPEELAQHYDQQATQAGRLGFDDLSAQQTARAQGVRATLAPPPVPVQVPAQESLLGKWDRVSRAAQLPGASAERARSLSDAYAQAASRASAPR